MDWLLQHVDTVAGWVTIPLLYLLYKRWPFGRKPVRMELPTPKETALDWELKQAAVALSVKKALHRRQHSEWDIEFYGLVPAPQKIVWNGVEMTLEEADKQYYRDEAINRMRLQQRYLGDIDG